MLPVATHASHKDSFGSIAELSVFSLVPPDEERRDCQAMDGPVGYLGRSTSFTRHRSSYDIKFSSGDNTSYVAQTLAHDPNVNCYTPRSVLDSTSSPSHNEVNQKPPSRLRSLDQRDYAICNRSGYSTAKKEVLKSQSYYAIRQDLLARLEQGSSEDGLGKELKVMISMMARMNTLLLGLSGITIVGAPKISMNAHTINQGTAVAAQMKHYFNSLGQKYENQLGNIAAIKNYLPFLGPNVKSTLVRTALKIWNERIVITANLASPQPHQQLIFTRLSTFYATQVFIIFLLKPQYPSEHPIHTLAATLLEHIPRSMAHVCATHAALIRETENLARAMSEARTCLPSALGPMGCVQEYRQERYFQDTIARLKRKARKAGIAMKASAPQASERRPRRGWGTSDGYPVISLREYMATATARREEGAKAKGRVTTEGEGAGTAQPKGKRLTKSRDCEEKMARQG